MHLYLLLCEGQAEYYYAMFSLCETNKRLAKHCYSWIFCLCLFILQHSLLVLLLELCLSCYDWSTMIPALNVLQILLSSLWWCMSPQKLLFLFITYLLEDEGFKLGDAWYIGNVSIIFDGFMLIICFWHSFLYKVYDLFGLTY